MNNMEKIIFNYLTSNPAFEENPFYSVEDSNGTHGHAWYHPVTYYLHAADGKLAYNYYDADETFTAEMRRPDDWDNMNIEDFESEDCMEFMDVVSDLAEQYEMYLKRYEEENNEEEEEE